MKIQIKLKKITYFLLFISCLACNMKELNNQIRICRPNNMVASLLYLTDFKQPVTFLKTTNAKASLDLMIAGQADFMAGGDGPFVYLATKKPAVKIVGFGGLIPETALFTREDSGISKESDIKGKKIGYLPGTVSFIYLANLMEAHNLTPQDLTLVPLQPTAMASSLYSKIIDGFIIWEPWGINAQKLLGNNFLSLRDTTRYQYSVLYLATDEFIKNHREQLKSILRDLLSFDILSQQLKYKNILSDEIPIPIEVLDKYWDQYGFKITSRNDSVIETMDKSFRLLKKYDQNFKDIDPPDFRSFIDTSILDEINKE